MKRHRPAWAAFALLAAATTKALAGDAVTLRIGTEAGYPPFEYRDASGALKGLDVDVGNLLCQRMHTKCEWVVQDFDGLIPALQAGKIDLIVASLTITPERAKSVDFSRPYYSGPSQLAAPKETRITEDPATWKGKAIGVESGTVHQVYLERQATGVDEKVYPTLDEAYLDLEAGRIDAVLADKIALYDWLAKEGRTKGFAFAGKELWMPPLAGDAAIGLRKGDAALKDKIDAAIGAILADGTFDKLNAAYLPFSIRPK